MVILSVSIASRSISRRLGWIFYDYFAGQPFFAEFCSDRSCTDFFGSDFSFFVYRYNSFLVAGPFDVFFDTCDF